MDVATEVAKPLKRGFFMPKSQILDTKAVRRAIKRMAHEVIERNEGIEDVIVVGLLGGGIAFAEALADDLSQIEEANVSAYHLDVSNYRDDSQANLSETKLGLSNPSEKFDPTDKKVIIVDDVLHTGRTVRSALDAIIDFGRPSCVQLCVMVDRGHRELPIKADYVGKNLPTKSSEAVYASLDCVEIGEVKTDG